LKALVTGASRGIGLAICKELAKQNIDVIGISRNVSKEVNQSFTRKVGIGSKLISLDITNHLEVMQFFETQFSDGELPDILINNAGITSDSMFHKMSLEQWNEVLFTNLTSLFSITQPIYKSMLNKNFGRIINISSVNGQKGQAGQTNYSASKAGMHGFTMALAQEGAKKNVLVNSISPGYIATDMVKNIREDIQEKIKDGILMNRFGEVEEIAKVVLFLIGDASNYITGENLSVNGGLLIKN
jgi:acetoacetyl-CoA reductase